MPTMTKAIAILTIAKEFDAKKVTETGYKRCKRAMKHLGLKRSQMKGLLYRLDFDNFIDRDNDFTGVEGNIEDADLE